MIAAILLAVAVQGAVAPQTAGAPLTMTCYPVYKGNNLGPQVYRVEGVELIKNDPSFSEPIIMSSAVKRQALDRTVDKGVVTLTSAKHRIYGKILIRSVFWTSEAGVVRKMFNETYDFQAKTIRDLTGAIERCK